MNLWALLEGAAREHPSRTAIRDGERSFDYTELLHRARGLAAWMRARGITAGDRVAILSRNRPEFLVAYFAAPALGAITVPWNTRLTTEEHAAVLRDSGAKLLLSESGFESTVAPLDVDTLWIDREMPPGCEDFDATPAATDDVAHLYFTSGTTGRPKGVMLTHANVVAHARMTIDELALCADDTWGHIAPMFHLADAWATFAVTMVGGTHAFLGDFSAGAALDVIARDRVTLSNLVPTMLNLMVATDHAADTSSLRAVLSGGAPIAPEVVGKIVARFGCEYVQTYGMTETSPFLTMSLLDDELRGLPEAEQLRYRAKTGRPVQGVELRVVDSDGTPVVRDERAVGEIQVRGATVTPGYWNDANATAAAFTADGFLHTGDLAVVDGRNFVTIVDRAKDVILSGGETVYSVEVENRLYEHPDVLEAAVVGHPDATWGEAVIAFVAPRAGRSIDTESLRTFCRESLAGYKTPKSIHLVDALPRTGSGKIDKKPLRAQPTQ